VFSGVGMMFSRVVDVIKSLAGHQKKARTLLPAKNLNQIKKNPVALLQRDFLVNT